MRRFLLVPVALTVSLVFVVPVALTVSLVFVVGSWADARLNPPCNAHERGAVIRTEDGRVIVEEGQPGNSDPPCRLGPKKPKWKGPYVPQ